MKCDPTQTPAALRSRARIFYASGNIDGARRLFSSADEIEQALNDAADPGRWVEAADVAPLYGLTACECGVWVDIKSDECEQCGAAVLPF